MKHRNIIMAAIAALVLLAAIAVRFGWFSSKPVLTIYLRCNGEVSGTLSVATLLENGELGCKESFDLETACGAGKIEFRGYLGRENLQFVFERGDGQKYELITEYGRDIQSDQDGFYTVLKIMNTPPFIANDSI